MAHADLQVSADLSTVRVWHRRNLADLDEVEAPLVTSSSLLSGLAGGWTCNGQWFSWDEPTLRAKWDSAQ
eukprot:334668-Amphidinium_carterae.1